MQSQTFWGRLGHRMRNMRGSYGQNRSPKLAHISKVFGPAHFVLGNRLSLISRAIRTVWLFKLIMYHYSRCSFALEERTLNMIWNAVPGTADALELDALATLVDAYERKSVPIRLSIRWKLSNKDAKTWAGVDVNWKGWDCQQISSLLNPRSAPWRGHALHEPQSTKATQLRFAADKRRKAGP